MDDAICPLKFAIQLDGNPKNNELYITRGGHSDSESVTEQKLIEILSKKHW